jgi:hypothetical protein
MARPGQVLRSLPDALRRRVGILIADKVPHLAPRYCCNPYGELSVGVLIAHQFVKHEKARSSGALVASYRLALAALAARLCAHMAAEMPELRTVFVACFHRCAGAQWRRHPQRNCVEAVWRR